MLDVSLFFHECSVFTSKLDPNYNLVYKFNTYVTGYGKTDHFAHNFKIELLVFKGSVDLKQ